MASDLIDVAMTLHHETHKGEPDAGAILVSDDGDREKAIWLPKSQVEFEPMRGSSTIVTVTLPEYLALAKGLI